MQKNGNGGGLRNSQHRSQQPLLTVAEVAEWFEVSEEQVRHLLHRGAIPAARVDGVWRFSRDKLERWVLDAI